MLHHLNVDYYIPDIGEILLFSVVFLSFHLLIKRWKISKALPPGPIGLPFLGYAPFLEKNPAKTFAKIAEKYGPVFSLNLGKRYTVVLNDYNAIKAVLTHPASFNRPAKLFGDAYLGVTELGHPVWKEQRRFFSSTLRDLGLGKKSHEIAIQKEVGNFVAYLASHKEQPVEVYDQLRMSFLNNILSMVFGRDLRDNEGDKVQLAKEFASIVMIYSGQTKFADLFPILRNFLKFCKIAGYNKAEKVIKDFEQFILKEIASHKSQDKNNCSDYINNYLKQITKMEQNAEKRNHSFTEENLLGGASTLIIWSTDTAWSALGWLMRLMAKHKDIQEKVYNEITQVLSKEEVAKYEDRDKLPYTFAVLMEMQRIGSLFPLISRVVIEDVTVNDYTIPKGAEIIANFWAVHHDPKNWEEPDEFRPERFLSDHQKSLSKNHTNYIPFSIGKRNCPGENIAWKLLLTYFTEIVRNFEISMPQKADTKFEIAHTFLSYLKPQELCFVKRNV